MNLVVSLADAGVDDLLRVATGLVTGRGIDDVLAQGALRPRGLSHSRAAGLAEAMEEWLSSPSSVPRPRKPWTPIVAAVAAAALAGAFVSARGWRAITQRANGPGTGLPAGDRASGSRRH